MPELKDANIEAPEDTPAISQIPGAQNTYKTTPAVDTALSILIGNIESPDFIPHVDISAWEGRASISLALSSPETGSFTLEPDNSIKWRGNKKRASFSVISASEIVPEGGLEFDVTLDERPYQDKVLFDLDYKNAEFYRQPFMTELIGQDEIVTATETEARDASGNLVQSCPENVPGSYAVYHTNPPPNIDGEFIYKSGKIGHIYRPRITDADGKTTWGTLKIDLENNTLSIILPPDFLDKAVYPIIIDPTFGYTTVGASSIEPQRRQQCAVSNALTYVAGASDNITQFSVYGSISGDGTLDMAAYTIVATVPVNRLALGVSINMLDAAGWRSSAAIAQIMTNGIRYGVAFGNQSSGNTGFRIYYDNGSGKQRSGGNVIDHNPLPAVWNEQNSDVTIYSMYATYASYSIALSGTRVSSAKGSVTPGLSKTPSGQRDTLGSGTIKTTLSKTVSGSREISGAGTVKAALSKELTGTHKTAATGTAKADISIPLTGHPAATVAGTVIPSLSGLLSGQTVPLQPGTVKTKFSIPLTGTEILSGQNAPVPENAVPLSGEQSDTATGSVLPKFTLPLKTNLSVISQGNLQGLKSAILFFNGLSLFYELPAGTNAVRVMQNGNVYGIPVIAATDDHAGSIRIKQGGTVYALKLEK